MPKASLVDRPTRRVRRSQGRTARPLISLAMIVRNEAEGLARCLASVAGAVDEILIVDTGSTDATKAIAARFADRVCDYAWRDDFAAARQFAFEQTRGAWILWLDGDDEVTGAASLRELAAAAAEGVGALGLKYITGMDGAGNVTQEFWRERLVRRGAFRWAGRVHEVLVPVGTQRQVEVDGCVVRHHGKAGGGAGGLARNVSILRAMAAQESPPVPRTLFYLARDLMCLGEAGEAEATFRRYLALAVWAEERYMAQLYLVQLCLLRAAYSPAYSAGLAALGEWPAWPQAYFALAEVDYYRQEWRRVIAWCDIGRGLPIPASGLFIDPHALRSAWIIHYTNALYHAGLLSDALAWTKRALELLPDDLYHRRNLAFFSAAALGATGMLHRDLPPPQAPDAPIAPADLLHLQPAPEDGSRQSPARGAPEAAAAN